MRQVQRDGRTVHRVTLTGNSTKFLLRHSKLQTAEFVTVVEVTPEGRINSVSIDYVDARTGEPASITITYSEFGSVGNPETRPRH